MGSHRLFFSVALTCICLIVIMQSGTSANQNDDQNKAGNNGYFSKPRKVGLFGEGAPVYGVYRYKGSVYLVRDSSSYVEIYDARLRNDLKGNLTVDGMQGPYDLVGSDDSRSLFIMDWFDWGNVTTVSTKAQNQVNHFDIVDETFTVVGLTAVKQPSYCDVLLTCTQSRKIKEFTKLGELRREIQFPAEITQPRHTIKLSSGNGYVVCHGYGAEEKHRVCLLDNTGAVLDCFGNMAGRGPEQLDVCARVAEDDNGNILVADRNNKRVLLLSNQNGKLKFVQELVKEVDGLNGPTRIVIDWPILYVADNTINTDGIAVSGRVLVYRVRDGKINF